MNTTKYMSGSDCDALLEDELSHHDPTRAAHLFTVLQRLLTPTSQQDGGTLYLHRGVNATRRVFFKALCEAIGGCVWIDTALPASVPTRVTSRFPTLVVLDDISTEALAHWPHLWSLVASPHTQVHALQGIGHYLLPTETASLAGFRVEQYNWRDTNADALIGAEALAPAIAAWLGIVGGAHPPDTHLCAAVDSAPVVVPATPEIAPSARSLRRGLLGAAPSLWPLGGACDSGPKSIITDEPRPVLPLGTHVPPPSPCRESPCMAAARSAPAEEHAMCGDRAFRVVQAPTSNALPPGVGDAPSTASSADTTPIGQAPSAVSPSAATWPQESQSAATATQPGSTRSSAETVQPSGESAAPTKRIPRGPLDALAQRAATTAVYPGAGTGDLTAQLYTALSLAGEAGEVAGKASKVLRDGVTPALLAAIHRELGDVLWHWLMACVEWGAEPDRIAEEMLQRLQDRARRGVVRGSGDER